MNDSIEELVERVKGYQVRRYILQKQPEGLRKWQGEWGERRCNRSDGYVG